MSGKKVIAEYKVSPEQMSYNKAVFKQLKNKEITWTEFYVDKQYYFTAFHWHVYCTKDNIPWGVIDSANSEQCLGTLFCYGQNMPNEIIQKKNFAKSVIDVYNGKVQVLFVDDTMQIVLDGRTHFGPKRTAAYLRRRNARLDEECRGEYEELNALIEGTHPVQR